MTLRIGLTATALAAAALLAACGGGGDSGTPADPAAQPPVTQASAAGIYTGTSGSGATLRNFSVLLVDTGRFYSLYTGPAGGTPQYIAGVVIGNGVTSASNFTASTVRDFNFETPQITVASLGATFVPKTSIAGSLTASGAGSVPFSATYDSSYEQAPSLAKVAGTYTGSIASSVGEESASVVISSNGTLTGISSGGCNATGTVSTHASGNVYDVSLTFGSGCIQPSGTTFTGHAFLDEVDKTLITVVSNSASTDGVLFIGAKP